MWMLVLTVGAILTIIDMWKSIRRKYTFVVCVLWLGLRLAGLPLLLIRVLFQVTFRTLVSWAFPSRAFLVDAV